jgi:amino acid transporter
MGWCGPSFPDLGYWPMHLTGIGIIAVIIFLLYRRIESIRMITTALWVIMLLAVGLTIAASYSNFHPSLAFHYPHNAFGTGFATALGAGLLIAIYDYLGYNTTAYMGGELRNPGKVMPRSIIISIVAIMVIYLAMNIGVVGVLRRRQPGLIRPYKQWLYPVPSVAALAGWLYVYASATATALIWSTVWIAAGIAAYLGWARYHQHWPFGPKQIREVFLETQREHPQQAVADHGAQWADS